MSAVNAAGEFITFFARLADSWEQEGPFDQAFVVPHATGGVNFARGGVQYNIVAERAVLEYDFRILPSMTTESVVQRLEGRAFWGDPAEDARPRGPRRGTLGGRTGVVDGTGAGAA